MNIKPLGNRVVIKRSKALNQKGKIIIPDSAQEKPKEGEIIAVGPGKSDEQGKIHPLHVKIGDRVLFASYSGTEIEKGDSEEELLILSEDDILGIVN
ncbi:MAG: co-chaperone GroES [Waddliaceae bacterium]